MKSAADDDDTKMDLRKLHESSRLADEAAAATVPAGCSGRYSNLKITIHNIAHDQTGISESKDAEVFAQSLLVPVEVTVSSSHDGRWFPKTFSVELILHMEQKITDAGAEIERIWFDVISSKSLFSRSPLSHLWLEIDFEPLTKDCLMSPKHIVGVAQLSLGTFSAVDVYRKHWVSEFYAPRKESRLNYSPDVSDTEEKEERINRGNQHLEEANISAQFEHDAQIISIRHTDSYRETQKMEITYDNVEKCILVAMKESYYHLHFFLKNQPKVYKKILKMQHSSRFDKMDQEEREVNFGSCSREIIGSSNVLHLIVSSTEADLKGLMSRFSKLGFSTVLANPNVFIADPTSSAPQILFEDFDTSFAWFCLLSRGFRVTDQLNQEFLHSVKKSEQDSLLADAIHATVNAFDRNFICSLKETFEEEMNIMKGRVTAHNDNKELQIPHIVRVRHVMFTPTTVKGLGEKLTVENRVIREFGPDRFIQIFIRDEDFQLLSPFVPLTGPLRILIEFLTTGLDIGDRHYHFLGCSNSQLRQHGVWMYADDAENTVESIRRWMGDLDHERCVATYVAHLGQCFSSSKDSVEVSNVDRIEDIRNEKYCFTDGTGKISESLAKSVCEALNLEDVPSAFQIHYGGCTGVVSLAPELKDDKMLQIRKSMEKFLSSHNRLEVVQTTRPGLLHLNRQVIVLMSRLGVPDSSFFKLQESMLRNLADMLTLETKAVQALGQSNLGLQLEVLTESGLVVTMEPFLRSVLLTMYRQRLNDLRNQTKIEISSNKGRIMMGIVDETGSLEYGQVFVQYSKTEKNQQVKKEVLTGQLVIAKNPCFHPGDLRKFQAVDILQLHHMVDCVVFPSKGPRPHPNEMSGSDLDGDMYFVCWDESLIPPNRNEKPMDFKAQPKEFLDHKITESDVIVFIANYIGSDQLGVIANSHLVHADAKGISSKECLELAQMHSDSVDFPKTGKNLRIPSNLRPCSYPHYMMKHNKPVYKSKHVIAKLFDQCTSVLQSNCHKGLLPVEVNQDFLLPGYERYLESTALLRDFYEQQIGNLMTSYGIDTEAELLSVTILKIQKQRGYFKADQFEIAEIVRLKLQSIRQNLKNMFYEEFGGENNKGSRKNEVLLKTSALYFTTYNKAKENSNLRRNIGLPWMFWDNLLAIKKMNADRCTNADGTKIQTQWKSFLHKISREINDAAEGIEKETQGDRRNRLRIFSHLQHNSKETKLILFGSTASTFDTPSSSLNIYVNIGCVGEDKTDTLFAQTANMVAKETGGTIPKQFFDKKKVAFVKICEDGATRRICLLSNKRCLFRTAYIIAASGLNKWMIPAIKIALAWGRNNSLVGDVKECLLKPEQFIIIFYHIVINIYRYGFHISEDAQRKALNLIEENHFVSCPVIDCSHFEGDCHEVNITSVCQNLAEMTLTDENADLIGGSRAVAEDMHSQGQSMSRNVADTESRLGEVLLQFYRHFSSMSGDSDKLVRDMPDPSLENGNAKIINHLKPEQCQQVVRKMMQAHHSLANSTSIHEFLSKGFSEDGPYTAVLPSQVSSSNKYRKARLSEKIRVSCGADVVTIREKKYRGDTQTCLILEAWGSSSARLKVQEKVQDLIASSSLFLSANYPMSRPEISDAYKIMFEHCPSLDARVSIIKYLGPHQPGHDQLRKQIPHLYAPDQSVSYDMDHFLLLFKQQRDFIIGSYDKNLNGELRSIISYGTYYICNCTETVMTTEEFEDMINRKREEKDSAHVNWPHRGNRGRSRGRGGFYGQRYFDKSKNIRSSFIPAFSANIDSLGALLKQHDFILKTRRIEYRPSVKMSRPGQGNIDGVLVLNQKFEFQSFILPDENWLVIDTIRDKAGVNKNLKDIRFKIQSRPICSKHELRKYQDLEQILRSTNRLLLRSHPNSEVHGIHPDFKDRIKFLRRKDVHEFEYRGKTMSEDSQDFMDRITIRVNFGKEFTRMTSQGIFSDVSDDRLEVTVTAILPDLKDSDECDEFIKKVWVFSKEFGELLHGSF